MMGGIGDKEVVQKLGQFGFEETDARIYIGLNQLGEITVGNLATRLSIDRTKTYRSLNKLKNMGVVSTTFSNPVICKAIPPKQALTEIIERKEDELLMLQKFAKEIVSDLECIRRNKKTQNTSTFSIIQGRTNIYGKIIKMINEAKNDIYIISTVDDVIRMYHTAIPEKIKQYIKKGGKVYLITDSVNEKEKFFIDKFVTTETRLEKLPSGGRIVLEKDNQVIMSGYISSSMSLNDEFDSVMVTNANDIVTYIYNLCTYIWSQSKHLELQM